MIVELENVGYIELPAHFNKLFEVVFLKKFLVILLGVGLVVGGFLIFNAKQEQEIPKILSKLEDKGFDNGGNKFIFSLENVGENNATLEFPSWLEYNVSLTNMDGKELSSGNKVLRHLDLDEKNDKRRTLVLEPKQSIEYRIIVGEIPNGNYELTISSASGHGGVKRKEFTFIN